METLNGHRPDDKYSTIDKMNDGSPSKWGELAKAGFQTIPDALLQNQLKLGVTSTDMIVLMNLTMDWKYPTTRPFPRSTTIAGRMGVVVRTVQRALATLRRLGLLAKVKETSPDGNEREAWDLSGLVEHLAKLAEDHPSCAPRTGTPNFSVIGVDAESRPHYR